MTTGRRPPGDKETWWWNGKVQEVIKAKKMAKNIWETSRRQEDKDIYRQANKAAKKEVATNKALAINELYEELETQEGERKIFRIAKARDKASKDFSHMKQIKNEHGVILRDLDMIIGRWKGYFDKLLDEENPRSVFDDGVQNEGLTQGISKRGKSSDITNEERKGNRKGWDSCRGVEVFGRRRDRLDVASGERDEFVSPYHSMALLHYLMH